MTTKYFFRILFVLTALLLPVIYPSASRGETSENEIDVPLFEGGAGKDWFYFSARAYEVNGKWNLSSGGVLEIKQAAMPIGEKDDFDLMARVVSANGGASAWVPLRQRNSDYLTRDWVLSAPELSGTFTTDGRTLRGELKIGGAAQSIMATKPNPMSVYLSMDPRVEDKMRVRFLGGDVSGDHQRQQHRLLAAHRQRGYCGSEISFSISPTTKAIPPGAIRFCPARSMRIRRKGTRMEFRWRITRM